MIGIWSEFATHYLITWALFTLVFFTIPLFFAPIAWAKVLKWNIPTDTDLAVYFGRCLGGVGCGICGVALHAGLTNQGVHTVFLLFFGAFTLLTIAHIWGAIKRIQPLSETLEIGLWLGLVLLSVAFYPAA